jgi:hypothetical protein
MSKPNKLVQKRLPEKCSFGNSEICPFSEQKCKSKSTFEGVILSNGLNEDLTSLEKIPIESLYMYRPNMVNCNCVLSENGFIDFKTSTCLKIWKLQDRILEIEQIALSTEKEKVLDDVNLWVLSTLKTVLLLYHNK